MSDLYDFEEHMRQAAVWEKENNQKVINLSAWENTFDQARVPWSVLNNAWTKAKPLMNTYITSGLLADMRRNCLHVGKIEQGIDVLPLASATTALYCLLATLKLTRNVKRILLFFPAYIALMSMCKTLKISLSFVQLDIWTENGEMDIYSVLPDDIDNYDAIILTDPVYSAGVPIPSSLIIAANEWSIRTGGWVVYDMSFKGMPWNDEQTLVVKPSIYSTSANVCWVWAPSKVLFINGCKLALLFAPANIIPDIDKFADKHVGNITAFQAMLFDAIYSYHNAANIIDCLQYNAATAKRNHEALTSLCNYNDWRTIKTQEGFHTIVYSTKQSGKTNFDPIKFLKKEGVVVIPLRDFEYSPMSPTGYRFNLINNWPLIAGGFLAIRNANINA